MNLEAEILEIKKHCAERQLQQQEASSNVQLEISALVKLTKDMNNKLDLIYKKMFVGNGKPPYEVRFSKLESGMAIIKFIISVLITALVTGIFYKII